MTSYSFLNLNIHLNILRYWISNFDKCFSESWEKVNLKFNDNGTVTFQQQKIFKFDPDQSVGDESDMVVVPNIPMLVSSTYLCIWYKMI